MYKNYVTRDNPSFNKLYETEHVLEGNTEAITKIFEPNKNIYNMKMEKFCTGELKN